MLNKHSFEPFCVGIFPSQIKPKLFKIETEQKKLPHVYVCASFLCCFHSPVSYYPSFSEGTDSIGGQMHGDKECPLCNPLKAQLFRFEKKLKYLSPKGAKILLGP